jgi:hypothetical protein
MHILLSVCEQKVLVNVNHIQMWLLSQIYFTDWDVSMPKYLVETISVFRMRYVIEANSAADAKNEVTTNVGELAEFSQHHVDELVTTAREIDDAEYLRQFDEDNEYLKDWTEGQKFSFVNAIDYD